MKYVVQTPVLMDSGKMAKVDSSIELTAEDAAALLACGAVREMDKPSNDEAKKK